MNAKMLFMWVVIFPTLLGLVGEARGRSSIFDDARFRNSQLKSLQQQANSIQPYVYGGTKTSAFPEVVAIEARDKRICSGTLVSPIQVLTACHCVNQGIAHVGSTIIFGPEIKKATSSNRISIVRARKMDLCGVLGGRDIAMIWMEKPAPVIYQPRPVADVDSALAQAEAILIVGYGDTETGKKGEKFFADVGIASKRCDGQESGRPPDSKRYGCVPQSELVAGKINVNKDTCPGDSGGPAYIRVGSTQYAFIGVTSRKVKDSLRVCGDGGIYVLLDGKRSDFLAEQGITPGAGS